MWLFLQGLPSNVVQEILYNNPSTLQDVQKIARTYQQARRPLFSPHISFSNTSHGSADPSPMEIDAYTVESGSRWRRNSRSESCVPSSRLSSRSIVI